MTLFRAIRGTVMVAILVAWAQPAVARHSLRAALAARREAREARAAVPRRTLAMPAPPAAPPIPAATPVPDDGWRTIYRTGRSPRR